VNVEVGVKEKVEGKVAVEVGIEVGLAVGVVVEIDTEVEVDVALEVFAGCGLGVEVEAGGKNIIAFVGLSVTRAVFVGDAVVIGTIV